MGGILTGRSLQRLPETSCLKILLTYVTSRERTRGTLSCDDRVQGTALLQTELARVAKGRVHPDATFLRIRLDTTSIWRKYWFVTLDWEKHVSTQRCIQKGYSSFTCKKPRNGNNPNVR